MFTCLNVGPVMQEIWVRSLGWEDPPGEGNSYPLQDSGLGNSMDCIVHGVAKSWTQTEQLSFSLTDLLIASTAPGTQIAIKIFSKK